MAENQIQRVRNWHEALVDFELMHPAAKLRDLALHFDKSMSWISIVKNSAAYREYRAQRLQEHHDHVESTALTNLQAIADITTEEMLERVEEEREKLSIADLGGMASLALKNLGYSGGPKHPTGQRASQINNFFGVAPPSVLEQARARYKEVHDANTKLLESKKAS